MFLWRIIVFVLVKVDFCQRLWDNMVAMKEVSRRDFQRHASDYMDDLPIVLTRYGKPVAVVRDYNEVGEEEGSEALCQVEGCDNPAEKWVRVANDRGIEAAYYLCEECANNVRD